MHARLPYLFLLRSSYGYRQPVAADQLLERRDQRPDRGDPDPSLPADRTNSGLGVQRAVG